MTVLPWRTTATYKIKYFCRKTISINHFYIIERMNKIHHTLFNAPLTEMKRFQGFAKHNDRGPSTRRRSTAKNYEISGNTSAFSEVSNLARKSIWYPSQAAFDLNRRISKYSMLI